MENVRIADNATIKGNVTMGADSSVWYGAVIRAENSTIEIGKCTNVQDNCVIHVNPFTPVKVGDYVTIGHGAIVHGCTVGNNTLIGMGAIILNNAAVGDNCIIGAGALIPEGKVIPDNSLVVGVPGRIVRHLNEEDIKTIRANAEHYVKEAKEYL